MSLRHAVRRAVGAALTPFARGSGRGRILLYHRIDDGADPIGSVSPSAFEAHLEALAVGGLRSLTVTELRANGFPQGQVAISFDDGDVSCLAAWERLRARGWGATFFVVPEWLGRPGTLSWADVRALAGAGAEIGSHGLRHEALEHHDQRVLTGTLAASRARLEDVLGRPVPGIAYPFGIAPRRARLAAHRAGFAYACGSDPGSNDPHTDPFALRRNEVYATDARPGLLAGKLRGADDWMRPVRGLEGRFRHGA